jgi:hypothetical protein
MSTSNSVKQSPKLTLSHAAFFLIGCIGTRSLFAYIAKQANAQYLKWLGYLALLPAIGFMYIFLTGSRPTGLEVGGGAIWWNNLRPLHAAIYILFAYLAITGNTQMAWRVLAADVVIGVVAFLIHHFT